MRRRKNESTSDYADRYQKQPIFYKEYKDTIAKRPGDFHWSWDVRTALKSRGWEGEEREWSQRDDMILKIIRSLGSVNIDVIWFVPKHMKFQLRHDIQNQIELLATIVSAVGDIAEIKFSTSNTVWIRFKT